MKFIDIDNYTKKTASKTLSIYEKTVVEVNLNRIDNEWDDVT